MEKRKEIKKNKYNLVQKKKKKHNKLKIMSIEVV